MPFDAFLKLGDGSRVKGGADDAAHKGEIELLSFGLKAAKAGGPGGPSASFSAFTLRKRADRATPLLVQACASGEQFDSARVTVRKPAGAKPLEFLIYTFERVLIDRVETVGGQAAEEVLEEVDLSFAAVHVKFVPQKTDGTPDSPVEGGWDLLNNRPK